MKEMLRNPPSLIRIGNGSAKYEPRPITAARRPSRRMLPLLLVAFVLSYIAYTHLSGNGALPSMKAGKTSTSSFIRNGGNSGRDLPPAEVELEPRAHKLELVSPMYNIKVLRSILQHSNTSWQDKPKEAHGYFVQSLVWFQNIDGLRPDIPADFMTTACNFPDPAPLSSSNERTSGAYRPPYLTSTGILHTHQTHPDDRKIGHDFVFFIDCQVPPELQDQPDQIHDVSLAITMEVGLLDTPTLKGMRENITVIVGNDDIPLQLYQPPKERSEFAVCLSALTYSLADAPLWHLLEWRMYMRDIGVDKVDWYGREGSFGKFVETYKKAKGGQDTFSHVPNLVMHPYRGPPDAWEKYTDQDAWYMDCIMKNAFSSDYILIIDTDEFPMVDWRLENPLEQFKTFMRGVPASKGSIEFDRVGMARPYAEGKHASDELIQSQYNCINSLDTKVKTLYRARSVFAVNQHKPRRGGMYPMPPEAAKVEVNPKPHQYYLWHLQHGYQDEVWPKLVHYRYYNQKEMDACSDPSPMSNMPKYTEYLKKLSKEVASLASQITQMVGK